MSVHHACLNPTYAPLKSKLPTAGLQELKAAKEEEVSHLNQTVHDVEGAAARSEATYQLQIKQLEQQVAELRDIIDSSMHTKRASTLKLETAMNALNLSKGDAKRFIQVHLLQTCPLHSPPSGCTSAFQPWLG